MRRAWEGVWVVWLQTLMSLNQDEKDKTSIPSTRRRFLRIGVHRKTAGWPKRYRNSSEWIPWVLIFFSGSELRNIYNCKGSHGFVFYTDSEKRKLASIMWMDAISLHSFFSFVWHGYLQSVVAESLGHNNKRYHIHLFTGDTPVHDLIVYGYKWNVQIAGPGEKNRAHNISHLLPSKKPF